MTAHPVKNGLLVAAGIAAMIVAASAREVNAEQRVPVHPAVQTTTVGSQDVSVRTALYGDSDRSEVKYEEAQWRRRGRGWYGGYRGWYGYRPYYGPRYYSYYPYYRYRTPYYSYYGPRFGFYVAPRWGYYGRWW